VRPAATANAATPELISVVTTLRETAIYVTKTKPAVHQANAATWIIARVATLKAEPATTCAKDARSVSETTVFPVRF
jgi:hypothetical protein